MNILVSNDDGIHAGGIEVLADVCRHLGSVTVVAPDREQSGTSHSLSLHRPLRPVRRHDGSIQVDGTPTDCVMLAIEGLMPVKPDFVIAGINHGPNMGEDVLYSGTVAAAMEGVMLGVPGIAISSVSPSAEHMRTYEAMLGALLQRLVSRPDFPAQTLLNINLPAVPVAECRGMRVTSLGSRYFSQGTSHMRDPSGREMYWVGGGSITWTGGESSDHRATDDGYISVTPLQLDLTHHSLLDTVRGWIAD